MAEDGAGDDGLNEIAYSFFGASHFLADTVDGGAVVAVEFAADGVGEEFFGKAAGEGFFPGGDELAKLRVGAEGLAAVEFSGGVDCEFVGIAIAPGADGIVVFEGESSGVDFVVTLGAGGVGAVLDEFLAEGGGAADVGFDFRDVVGRRRRGVIKEFVHDIDPAHYG